MNRILASILAVAFLLRLCASDVTDLHPPWDAIKLVSFNQGSAADRSWMAQTPTTSAGVTFPAGYRTADFDGTSNAVVTYPDVTELEIVPMTVSFWVRIDSATANRCNLVGKHNVTAVASAARGWYVHWSPSFGHGVAFVEDGITKFKSRVSNRTTDNDGVWRHLAVTIDTFAVSSGWVFYVNGSSVTFTAWDGAATPTTTATTDPLMVGGINWQSGSMTRLNGALDDVRIYSRVLTANEIAAIYAEGIGASRP